MSRLNSFYLEAQHWPSQGEEGLLQGPEAHHLSQVLRTPAGTTVRLFDGLGREGLFEVLDTAKKRVRLRLLSETHHPRPANGLTVALGWSKSSRRGWILEKSAELQAAGILFWQAKRSQGALPVVKESWQEKLIQAGKQCGSNWLPELDCIKGGVAGLCEYADRFENKLLLWESNRASTLLCTEGLTKGSTLAVIGPEGGLDDQEADMLLARGFSAITLGASILRWETAALHCLSLAFHAAQKAAEERL